MKFRPAFFGEKHGSAPDTSRVRGSHALSTARAVVIAVPVGVMLWVVVLAVWYLTR